jgi:hypothetical protein
MARKTIITVLVLAVALALLYWYQQSRDDAGNGDAAALGISVFNQTKNQDALAVTANPQDVLVYTLTVENPTDEAISGYVVETSIDDLSELATLTDAAGANYNAATNALMWTPLDVPAEDTIQKQFSVRIKDSLPADSDLLMTASFGNEIAVTVSNGTTAAPVPTPNPGVTPSYEAPTTGPSLWFAVLLALSFTTGIVLYRAAKSIKA